MTAASPDPGDRARSAAAAAAADLVPAGATLGLGSGRAVWATIAAVGERLGPRAGLRAAVASPRTAGVARAAGIEVVDLNTAVADGPLELAIDGADEIDPDLGLLKGGGAALLREKLIVLAARRFVVVAETGKRVDRLGATRDLPVEIVRFGWRATRARLLDLVATATPRLDAAGEPVPTDEGHVLCDCALPAAGDLPDLGVALKGTTGVVEHGLFYSLAEIALLGTPVGEVVRLSRRPV